MNHGFRRCASMILAVLFAASSVLVCTPVAAAQGAEGHCKPASQGAGSHCPPKNAMDCCATSAPQPASTPQNDQQSTRGGTPLLLQAESDALAVGLHLPSLARTLRSSPPHGYRSNDLLILNAAFLI